MTTISRRAFVAAAGLLALGGAKPRAPLALEKAHPGFARLPRAGLWPVAPPIRHAKSLASALGLTGSLSVVRDDLAGTAFAGGKARKLDLILGAAVGRGVTAVATTGGTGSNHARSTAIAAATLGLHCDLALLPEPETPEIRRNLDRMRRAGATIAVGSREAVERTRLAADAAGAEWIPMGGTSPLGNVAFVDAAVELVQRARGGELAMPDVVIAALGSVGSAVGLAIGFALEGVLTRVVGVRASSPATSSRAVVDKSIDETVALLRAIEPALAASLAADAKARLEIDGGEVGGGYGVPTARGRQAQSLFHEKEGIPLELTYGAKAAAALVRRTPQWKTSHVVFWMGSDAQWLAGRAG